MKTRIRSTLVLIVLILSLLIPSALAADNTRQASAGYYYVYTENGKGLNVRDNPGGKIVGSLPYGDRIYCYYADGAWALIDYTYNKEGYGKGTYACFVSTRFLQKSKPAPKSASAAPAKSANKTEASTVEQLNKEFATAKKVAPYYVSVRPSRASGWVNLRWSPSTKAALIATYPAGSRLLVIAETANWLQVQDQATGNVGFMDRNFVTK